MRNGAIFLGSRTHIKESQNWRQISLAGCSKVPVRECLVHIFAGIRGTIATQHLRSVIVGIETHTQQMGLLIQFRISSEHLVDLCKVTTHPRAEISQRTTRVDECHQQDLPTKLGELNLLVT